MHSYHVIFPNGSDIQGVTNMTISEFVKRIVEHEEGTTFTWKKVEEPEEYDDLSLMDDSVPDEDDDDEQWPDSEDIQQEPINTDYVVVSTSFAWKETLVFPADKEGTVLDWIELAGIRGMTSTDHDTTMHTVDMYDDYEFVRVVRDIHPLYQTLWKKK